jgi:hypothetical protein
MLSKVKTVMEARGVKTELLCLYEQIRMDLKNASAGNWKVREAKVLQAREVPAMHTNITVL